MSLIADFMRDPHRFANLHTLYPFSYNPGHELAEKAVGGLGTQIRGQDKVAYCDLLPSREVVNCRGDMGMNDRLYTTDEGLTVMKITYQRPSFNLRAIPVYYLPWRRDSLMRMKLTPSSKDPKKNWRGKEIDPDLFVTAALQGCTVAVTGDPRSPLVYHLNASSVQGEKNGYDIAVDAKIMDMSVRFRVAQELYPKEGPKIQGRHFPVEGSVTGFATVKDYMMRAVHVASQQKLKQRFVNQFNPEYTREPRPKLNVFQFGTVFGIRKDGLWKFYRQTRTIVDYVPRGGGNNWRKVWVEPVCVRFWPT